MKLKLNDIVYDTRDNQFGVVCHVFIKDNVQRCNVKWEDLGVVPFGKTEYEDQFKHFIYFRNNPLLRLIL